MLCYIRIFNSYLQNEMNCTANAVAGSYPAYSQDTSWNSKLKLCPKVCQSVPKKHSSIFASKSESLNLVHSTLVSSKCTKVKLASESNGQRMFISSEQSLRSTFATTLFIMCLPSIGSCIMLSLNESRKLSTSLLLYNVTQHLIWS